MDINGLSMDGLDLDINEEMNELSLFKDEIVNEETEDEEIEYCVEYMRDFPIFDEYKVDFNNDNELYDYVIVNNKGDYNNIKDIMINTFDIEDKTLDIIFNYETMILSIIKKYKPHIYETYKYNYNLTPLRMGVSFTKLLHEYNLNICIEILEEMFDERFNNDFL